MALKIREINYTNDLQQLVQLHNDNYREHRKPDDYNWAYTGFQADNSVLTVAEDEGEIVGSQGMIPIYLNVGGQVYLTGKSENSLMDGKYPLPDSGLTSK